MNSALIKRDGTKGILTITSNLITENGKPKGFQHIARDVTLEKEMQSTLGIINEWAWRRTLERAGKYSLERLIDIYHRLLEADLAIKTGKYDGELALNLLIADLCERARK